MQTFLTATTLVLLVLHSTLAAFQPWQYQCDELKRCVKDGLSTDPKDLSLGSCQLLCGDHALLWPLPKTVSHMGDEIVAIDPDQIYLVGESLPSPLSESVRANIDEQIGWLKIKGSGANVTYYETVVNINITLTGNGTLEAPMASSMDESYRLNVAFNPDSWTQVNIYAPSYFGIRHAIETLFQLVEFNEIQNAYSMLTDVDIQDAPEFAHRGISVDTSRNFIEPSTVKKILDGMAASKLNVFHWHIVDTHSFPVELKTSPIDQMTQYGAYDAKSVYSQATIKEIIDHATFRGIQVIPEFDQPAHVGNGWNFPGAENFVVCFNQEPWYDYCVEPPCGQLNPAEEGIYDILEKLYVEFFDIFQYRTFHMGADEVWFPCWNSSDLVVNYMAELGLGRTEEDFIELWNQFQKKSSDRLKQAYANGSQSAHPLEIIIWTSTITLPPYIDLLDPLEYVIQIWTDSQDMADPQIATLVEKGFRMIFSNSDATYLDCGFGAWIGEGNNWCSPYHGWQEQYKNNPYQMIEDRGFELTDEIKARVLGGETAIWMEETDDSTIMGKIFPRAAAYGERLWSNPSTDWYQAESRMLNHRQRLVQRGVKADRLQPEWCRQNGGQCYGLGFGPEGQV